MSKVEIKETDGCQKKLNIEIENERFIRELDSSLKKIKNEVQIPGFRKGKAPESLLRKRFGSVIREEAIKDMIPKVLQEVFEEHSIKPVGEPEISDFKYVDESSPITFSVTVEELPEIDVSGFENLEVVNEIQEVSEEDIDEYLERLRHMRAERKEVEREAQKNDILVVNLQKLDLSGVPIIGEKIEGHVISLDGKGTPSPEFDKQVIGMKKGDQKAVQFTYDESIGNPDLVGKAERYDVEIMQVIENKLPELDEDFIKSLGEYKNLEDLRKKAGENIAKQNEYSAERKLQYDLINEFIKKNPFDIPNRMVDRVIQSEYENTKQNYPDQPVDEEVYKTQNRPDAVRQVQSYLIAEKIKEKQGFKVTKEEVKERLEEIARISDKTVSEIRRNLIKDDRFNSLKNDIVQKKIFDWMKDVANIKVETAKRKTESKKIITP